MCKDGAQVQEEKRNIPKHFTMILMGGDAYVPLGKKGHPL